MYKESWGEKRICPMCSKQYYDLGRAQLICPECGKEIEVTTMSRPRRGRKPGSTNAAPLVNPVPPKPKPLRCPPPQACPVPPPCKEGGRCPTNQSPKCKYYGIKTVESSKSIEEMINDLVNGDSEDKLEKLNALRNLLGVRLEEEKVKCDNNKRNNKKNNRNNNKPKPSNVDNDVNQPTTMASAPEDKSYLKPVVDYDNKCVDNTLFYSAEGILGSDFN